VEAPITVGKSHLLELWSLHRLPFSLVRRGDLAAALRRGLPSLTAENTPDRFGGLQGKFDDMPVPGRDPYETLGVSRGAPDAELLAAYRRLVKLHHPDHNNGSPESAARFEQIQDAYARIRVERERAPRTQRQAPPVDVDPDVEAKLGDLERELREAQAARERARRAAAEAAAATQKRPSDEELGYVRTDDSFSKLLEDTFEELSARVCRLRER
jgi:DnaJ domain